jgi:aminoglycoside phosphotransferase (APT) family kinase protein
MQETIPVRADEQFAVDRVAAFLRARGVTDLDPECVEVTQFWAGQSNLTYLLRLGAWEAVLRRPPLGPVAPRAHDMAREFHILERLHPRFPLAPRPFFLCSDPSVIGAPFYLMERRHGRVVDQDFPPDWQADPALHRALSESVVRVLVDLHAVDWQAAGLGEISRPDGYMRRQVVGWTERLARARTPGLPDADALGTWFVENLPAPQAPTVIHNDYKLNNVLLDADDASRVSAVLDWEMATVGEPLSDLAMLLVYWTSADECELMGGLRSVTAEPGFLSRREVLDLYARWSGRDVSDIQFHLAFAYFKIGVIVQQIYYRWHVGQTRDMRFAHHDVVATNLILKAGQLAGVS